MQSTVTNVLSPDVEAAIEYYDRELKAVLEADHSGKAIAIDPDAREYAIGATHREAARILRDRRPLGSRIVTLTIGPPTDQDIGLANRMIGLR